MKRIILPLLLLFAGLPMKSIAQNHIRFIYVTQDHSIEPEILERILKEKYEDAKNFENPTIFYLSNGNRPIIVKVNPPHGVDNSDDFESKFLRQLQDRVDVGIVGGEDKQRFLQLVRENDFVDEEGNLLYEVADMEFYVGRNLWDSHSNETLIAALYFELDAAKFIRLRKLNFNVFCPRDLELPKAAFGELNPDLINRTVTPTRIL